MQQTVNAAETRDSVQVVATTGQKYQNPELCEIDTIWPAVQSYSAAISASSSLLLLLP